MNIEDALYRAITGGRSPATEGVDAPSMIAEIERRTGMNHTQAAAYFQVPRTTWRNWRQGGHPKLDAFARLRVAQRRLRLAAGRERWLRANPACAVLAEVKISADVRDRVLRVSTWEAWRNSPPMGRVLDAWLRAHDITAGLKFLEPIEQQVIDDQGGLAAVAPELGDIYLIRFFQTEEEAATWARTAKRH